VRCLEVAEVLEDVMSPAAELEIFHVGRTVLEPVDDVVAVAVDAREVATVFAARAIPDLQGASLRGCDQARSTAEVENL
jgi:hypothetical protein